MLFFEILVVLGLTLLNGFFSMSEMAIVSARKARLEAMAEAGDTGARKAAELAQEPSRFLSSVQIGITLVGIVSGAFGTVTLGQKLGDALSETPVIAAYAEPIGYGIVILGITFLSIVLGELVPKRIALAHPEAIAARVARPLGFVATLTRPFVHLLSASTALILRTFRIRQERDSRVTEEEVETMLEEGTQSGIIDPAEQAMVQEVIGLAERPVTQIMTRRSAVYWIDVADDPKVARAELRQCPYSRVVIAKGNSIDEPLGFVHKKDLLDQLLEGKPFDIEGALREPVFVPDTSSVLDVIELFREKRNHFAFVLDEFGTFEGVVTLTDVLEAITGDIPEEHEVETRHIIERADGSSLVDGRTEISALESELGIAVPSDARFHTVAGLALEIFGRIPREGDVAEFGAWRVEIVDMDGRRIDKLLFSRRETGEG
ncbi:MAG: HlyC/CorC family transporter [Methylobacterium sp.]|nr:HlyC/CorC family transporter [Methylobacterium sp.]MCA3596491.1 HlyC/CorC family transporter [Methylobacterium sp.]MCA3599383.1 HlyC/CorC family transporter [Methylobacterium sp.]MCA3602804.1 HlyC/CorC family transporter [Methylobacterium sp.]MCA3605380.1 HlyC/CorC family transporter [Methylobacterium sp.]